MGIYNTRKEIRVVDNQLCVEPICPVCRKQFDRYHEPSMHEVFITKGDVEGTDFATQMLINDKRNCVLIHEGDCHIKAQHLDDHARLCVDQLMFFEGKEEIRRYLEFVQSLVVSRLDRAWSLYDEYHYQH